MDGSGRVGFRKLARISLGGALLLGLAGCSVNQIGVLNPQGPVGAAQKTILYNSSVIMVLAVLIPVIAMTIFFAWWYRAKGGQGTYRPTFAYSGAVELVVWGVPVLIVLFLSGITWIGTHQLDPPRPLDSPREAMEVQVVSLDWKWLFIYPTLNVASVNELVLPAGQPVRFRITSASVMNTFFVPQLGTMIYAMNGMETKLNLMADRPGTFEGLSAHYSGAGFSDMRFMTRAIDAAAFSQWVGEARNKNNPLDTAAYGELAKQSSGQKSFTYGTVQSGLFNSIVLRTAPDAPGPQVGEPRTDVRPRP